MVSSSWITSAERGILKVFLNIANITASYVGCTDLSSEVEVKWLQDINWLIHFQIFSKWSRILKLDEPSIDIWWFLNLVVYLI